jgi:GAF domain-containing protein
MIAALPEDETQRLMVVRSYQLSDSSPQEALDNIVRLARTICDCPIATISVIEESRQLYIAQVGMAMKETPRDIAFCAHTILEKNTVIVPDATKDPRFADNPVVTGDPYVRFYAGVPLVNAHGFALGTICVVDTKPRHLSNEQIWALESLRGHVVAHLELRRTMLRLEQALEEVAWLRRRLAPATV